jgi:hypothetical protein
METVGIEPTLYSRRRYCRGSAEKQADLQAFLDGENQLDKEQSEAISSLGGALHELSGLSQKPAQLSRAMLAELVRCGEDRSVRSVQSLDGRGAGANAHRSALRHFIRGVAQLPEDGAQLLGERRPRLSRGPDLRVGLLEGYQPESPETVQVLIDPAVRSHASLAGERGPGPSVLRWAPQKNGFQQPPPRT